MDSQEKPEPDQVVLVLELASFLGIFLPPEGSSPEQFKSKEDQCSDCQGYVGTESVADARIIVESYAQSIQDDRMYLREKLAQLSSTIANRWKKKSREKRASILQAGWPGIPHGQFPVIYFKTHPNFIHWDQAQAHREAFLLPSINIEILKDDPSRFLSLLHNRTWFSPDQWAGFDNDQIRLGWECGCLGAIYAECCVVLSGSSYGSIVPWDKSRADRWEIVGFPRAKLILEAQATLMTLIRRTVEALLEEKKITNLSTTGINSTFAKFNCSKGGESWHRLSNQAFSAPLVDINHLLYVSRSRLAAAEDHLWLLQTDANYFQQHVRCTTRERLVQDGGASIYNRFALKIWWHSVERVERWRWIMDLLETLSKRRITMQECLEPDIDSVLGELEVQLEDKSEADKLQTRELLATLPNFQHLFRFDYSHPDGVFFLFQSRLTVKNSTRFQKDPLFWCIWELTEAGDVSKRGCALDSPMVFGFLENWLERTTVEDKSRIDQKLLDSLSNIAATHELLAAVRQQRPHHKPLNPMEANIRRETTKNLRIPTDKQAPQKHTIAFGKLLEVFEKTTFPTGTRDEQWLKQADIVRNNSKRYWAEVQRFLKFDVEWPGYSKQEQEAVISVVSFDNSPQHLTALQAERDKILPPKLSIPRQLPSNSGLGNINTDITVPVYSDKENIQTKLPHHLKVKAKSRPALAAVSGNGRPPIEDPIVPVSVSIPKVIVKADSLRVFQRMFPSTVEEYSGKPLEWKRFAEAMRDTGFEAAHSGGSAVMFSKEGAGRIVFHKPHPVAKADQYMLQSWGKRMAKWFGWERGTFITAEGMS